MKNMLKKVSLPAWLFPLSAVLAIVALLVAIISCSGEGFGMKEMPLVITLTVIAALLAVGMVFAAGKKGDNVIVSAAAYVVVLLLAFCVCAMVMGKSDVFGTVIFSALERGYAPAEFASSMGIVSIVLYLVAAVAAMVGSFFRLDKAE